MPTICGMSCAFVLLNGVVMAENLQFEETTYCDKLDQSSCNSTPGCYYVEIPKSSGGTNNGVLLDQNTMPTYVDENGGVCEHVSCNGKIPGIENYAEPGHNDCLNLFKTCTYEKKTGVSCSCSKSWTYTDNSTKNECEYGCKTGYHHVNNAGCKVNECGTKSIPANATENTWTSLPTEHNKTWGYADPDSNTACSYHCNDGYIWLYDACVKKSTRQQGKIFENRKVGNSKLNTKKLTKLNWDELMELLDDMNERTIPAGGIMAFNLDKCPNGWTEFTVTNGRSLVGTSKIATPLRTGGNNSIKLTVDNLPPHHSYMFGLYKLTVNDDGKVNLTYRATQRYNSTLKENTNYENNDKSFVARASDNNGDDDQDEEYQMVRAPNAGRTGGFDTEGKYVSSQEQYIRAGLTSSQLVNTNDYDITSQTSIDIRDPYVEVLYCVKL